MSALTPTVAITYLSTNAFTGYPASGCIYDAANGVDLYSPSSMPTLTHGPNAWLMVGVSCTGSWSTTATGVFTKGTNSITDATTTGLAVGHQLSAPGYLPDGPVAVITGIAGSTITFSDISSPDGTDLTAIASGGTELHPISFTVSSPNPLGSLAFSFSPTAPGAMVDGDPDGTGNTSHIGDGTAVSNLAGQAEGAVRIALGAAGSYTLSATYNSSDPGYVTTGSAGLAFTVV